MELKNKSLAIIICSFAILLSIYFVFAANTSATPTSFSVNESVDSV